MFDQIFENKEYQTRSAFAIDQRVREREMQRNLLEAEYGEQASQDKPRLSKPVLKVLASLFAISI